MNDLTKKIIRRYNRFSKIYDLVNKPMDARTSKWNVEIIKELKGRALEVGVGTGKNIQFYPDNPDITAIDFSANMLEKAKEKAVKYNKRVDLKLMDVQNLEFQDNSFDTVFATCVFCSVPDPVQGLKEIKRVCKPEGKIILLEHVRSENKIIGALMDFINPVVVSLIGVNINRRTVENVKKAGFTKIEATNLWKEIIKKFVIYNVK